jgi:hypothetical protein
MSVRVENLLLMTIMFRLCRRCSHAKGFWSGELFCCIPLL